VCNCLIQFLLIWLMKNESKIFYKCTATFRTHCIWLGHEALRFCNLGTMDECTATRSEFDLMTELYPSHKCTTPSYVNFKNQCPLVQICAIQFNVKDLCYLAHLVFMILKMKSGYSLQQIRRMVFKLRRAW
jgi:hypothetical protein